MTQMARIAGDSPVFIRVIGAIRGQESCGLRTVARMVDADEYWHTETVFSPCFIFQ
jgi:hypothetical protein